MARIAPDVSIESLIARATAVKIRASNGDCFAEEIMDSLREGACVFFKYRTHGEYP